MRYGKGKERNANSRGPFPMHNHSYSLIKISACVCLARASNDSCSRWSSGASLARSTDVQDDRNTSSSSLRPRDTPLTARRRDKPSARLRTIIHGKCTRQTSLSPLAVRCRDAAVAQQVEIGHSDDRRRGLATRSGRDPFPIVDIPFAVCPCRLFRLPPRIRMTKRGCVRARARETNRGRESSA